jgi:hypothetical protein
MSLNIPKTNDTIVDLTRKLLWTMIQANYGVGSADEYNTAIAAVEAAGGDASSLAAIQSAAGGSSSRVGGFSKSLTWVPTVDTSAYADGDAIGDNYKSLALFRANIGSGVIQTVCLTCDGTAPAADFDIVLFRAAPSSSTLDDNDAAVFSDANAASIGATITVPSADWLSFGTGRNVQTINNLGQVIQNTDPDNDFSYLVYAVLLARGAITFAAADDLRITFGVLQD